MKEKVSFNLPDRFASTRAKDEPVGSDEDLSIEASEEGEELTVSGINGEASVSVCSD